MLATSLLLGLVLVAAVTDARRHKIYNWNTYTGMLVAIWLNALADILTRWTSIDRSWLTSQGWIGTWPSLAGLLLCGLLMLACFVLFRIGGGDVKLMAMVGAFLGPERGLEALLWTFVLGAAGALIVLVWRVGPWQLVLRVARPLLRVFGLSSLPPPAAEPATPLFLAPAALAAVIIVQFSLVERLPAWI